jgi:hypothetical protein
MDMLSNIEHGKAEFFIFFFLGFLFLCLALYE